MSALETAFRELLQRHGVVEERADQLWQEVVIAHAAPGRHYHTL